MEGNGSSVPPTTTTATTKSTAVIIEHKAYSRIGLLGNPSDVYYIRTISLNISNFWASVRLEPSSNLVIVPHPTHDFVKFSSVSHLLVVNW
ncbi:hypothetical protein L6452_04969 [Arctium lappa]|uniref:Uncharacterized protein n=1 Tax=Arctium lappa TaxID=4217 RepID=A0ACB9EF33_ARCLA|nr:hypothetical protein L6452_04969 [Arctium lappa]